MEFINIISNIVTTLNYYLWSYVLVVILLIIGIYFNFKLRLSQITMLGHALTLITKKDKCKAHHHISSFQAFSISMGSVVGVGSIAGVALAISLGGPGTIFWMWIISFIVMSTSLIEHTLGQVYKEKYPTTNNKESIFVGGPSYYILKGLKNKFLAYLFSIIIVVTYGLVFNSVQSNTISLSLLHAFDIPQYLTGIIVTILSAVIILGGIKRIAKISSIIVPCMGICYLLIILLIVIINIKDIPGIFLLIFKSAFGFNQAVSGSAISMFIHVLLIGTKRAMFSTEAGLGSTPNITASAFVKHPARQGLTGMLGVFFVAFIICTGTAIIILTSDIYRTNSQLYEGIALTQESLKYTLGSISVYILAFSIFIFGFTSIIGNYAYAEHNLLFIHAKKWLLHLLRFMLILTIFLGSIASLKFVWNLADLFMAFMIIINSWALFKLSKIAISVIFNYKKQLKYTKEPIFNKKDNFYLRNDKDNIW